MLDEQPRFLKLGVMNPSKVAVSLLFLTISLLLLGGCEGMLPTGSNPPGAVVPNPQPGAPIPGGLQIAFARAAPLISANVTNFKEGRVNVHFNGAATTQGTVAVEAQRPGWNIYTSAGSATFVPGQTDVQVPITVLCYEAAQVPLKVSIRGSSAVYQTTTSYDGTDYFHRR
jgi:hypothetical protein